MVKKQAKVQSWRRNPKTLKELVLGETKKINKYTQNDTDKD